MSTSTRAVFRATPGAVPMAVWSLVGRFGFAMTNVGLLLFVEARTGSYGVAGAVSAASLVGTALGMVGQGRLVDRYGPTRPLLVLCALYVGLGAVSVAGVAANLPPVVLAVLVLAACVALPAVSVASRTMWPHLIPTGKLRDAAYGYEAISFELCWLLGPAAAALLATLVWPGAGLLAAVVLASVGATGFALTATVRSKGGGAGTAWTDERSDEGVERAGSGPSRRSQAPAGPAPLGTSASASASASEASATRQGFDRRGFATLLLAAFGFGLAIGSAAVGVIAGTDAYGVPQASGVLLAVWSATSIVGGLLYQRWPWAGQGATRLPVLMAAFGLTLVVPALVGGVAALAAMIMLGGLTLVPQITAHNTLLDGLVPAARLTEAYGLVVTTIAVANAAGQAMAGVLVDRFDHQSSLLAGCACTLGLAAGVWVYRRRLSGPPPMRSAR
jgi:MFS family permease